MKRIVLLLFFSLISSFALYAHGYTLSDHSKIKELSSFTIMGEIDLRTEKDFTSPVKYRTLNHEGGMKVTVLEILKKDTQNKKSGTWLYVLLTAPMWVESYALYGKVRYLLHRVLLLSLHRQEYQRLYEP